MSRRCAAPYCDNLGKIIVKRYDYANGVKREYNSPLIYQAKYCSAHEKRKQRYGSYTARRCIKCHVIDDDEITVTLRKGSNTSVYYCNDCFGERLKRKKA